MEGSIVGQEAGRIPSCGSEILGGPSSSRGSKSLKRPTKRVASDWTEAQVLFRGSLPLVACQLIFQSMTLVDHIVLGQLTGQEGLSIAAFGQLFFNTCWFWVVGMTTNLDTILSRCQGAAMMFHVSLWLQRGWFLLFSIQIPFAVLHFNSTSVLKALGHDEDLARRSEAYIRVLFFAILPQGLVFVLIKYLTLHGLRWPQVHQSWMAAAVNVVLDVVLIDSWGPEGAAWATLISRWLQLLLLLLYVYAWEDLRGALWLPASELKALLQAGSSKPLALLRWQLVAEPSSMSSLFFKMMKGGVMMLLEAWAFELSVLLVSSLEESSTLSAHFCVLQFVAWTYTVFAFSVGTATNMRVAFLIGSGQYQEMWRTARCATLLAAAPMLLVAVAMLSCKHLVGRLWTPDAAVVRVVEEVVPVAAAFQVLDGVQAALAGMIRGIEGHGQIALNNLVGFWCCGSTVALLLHLFHEPNVLNAWYGLLVGLAVVTLLHAAHVARVNWGEEVLQALRRLSNSHQDCLRLMTRHVLQPFEALFPQGFHVNQDCVIPFKWAASRSSPAEQVYVAYIGLDNVARTDHLHVAGQTDHILVFHSLIIANRQLLLLMAATMMEAHLKEWNRFALQVFRGRSGPAMVWRLELTLEALSTPEGRGLVGDLVVKVLKRERMSGNDAQSESCRPSKGAGFERDLASEAQRLTSSKPFRAMRYTIEVGGRPVVMRVWIGYRGMDHMFDQTEQEDAGVFLGVSGVNGPKSAALILPQPEALYAYIRPSLSVHKVNITGVENRLVRLILELTTRLADREWTEVTELARGITRSQLRQKLVTGSSAWRFSTASPKLVDEGKVQEAMVREEELLAEMDCEESRHPVLTPSLQHCAARSGGFVSTREGIFTQLDNKTGARYVGAFPVHELPGTAVVLRRRSPDVWNVL